MKTKNLLVTTLATLLFIGQGISQELSGALKEKVETLAAMFYGIEDTRKAELDQIAAKLAQQYGNDQKVKVLIIDGENSTASQLAQLWLQTSAFYFQVNDLEVHSGGINPTSLNSEILEILKRWSFKVKPSKDASSGSATIDYGSGNWRIKAKSYSEDPSFTENTAFFVLDPKSASELKDKLTSKVIMPITFEMTSGEATINTSDLNLLNDQIAKQMVYLGYRLKLNLLELKKI